MMAEKLLYYLKKNISNNDDIKEGDKVNHFPAYQYVSFIVFIFLYQVANHEKTTDSLICHACKKCSFLLK